MSETSTTATETATDGQQQDTSEWTPPESQADLDRIINDRLRRQKAQFADYDALKSKAAEFDKLQQANQTEQQKQAEELQRWQTQAEQWRTTAVTSRIEALAAPDFAYPSDAVSKLDASKYIDAGGVVDEDGIKADLAALLAERPNWARQSTTTQSSRTPAPNPAQGSSGGSAAVGPAAEFAAILGTQLGAGR